jgi:hypothetical protein
VGTFALFIDLMRISKEQKKSFQEFNHWSQLNISPLYEPHPFWKDAVLPWLQDPAVSCFFHLARA